MVCKVLTNQSLLVTLNHIFFNSRDFASKSKVRNILILHIDIWSKTIFFLQFKSPLVKRNLRIPYLQSDEFWTCSSYTNFILLWKTFRMVQLVFKNFEFLFGYYGNQLYDVTWPRESYELDIHDFLHLCCISNNNQQKFCFQQVCAHEALNSSIVARTILLENDQMSVRNL